MYKKICSKHSINTYTQKIGLWSFSASIADAAISSYVATSAWIPKQLKSITLPSNQKTLNQ